MGKKEKLIQRLKSKPKDFSFQEAETLLRYFDYEISNKGKSSGSRVIFEHDTYGNYMLHRPHKGKDLQEYQLKRLIALLEQEKLI